MSVSLWAYDERYCNDICCGDCDLCPLKDKEEDDEQ